MKKITDMTDEEICALTEDQLDLLIKVECMESGIPLEPRPPEQSFFDLPKASPGYKVTGTELWLENRQDAEKIAKLLCELAPYLKSKKFSWQLGYDIEWLENFETSIAIEESHFYDKLQVQDREQFLVKRKTLKEQYEEEKKKYDSSREKVRKISNDIYSVYYDARKTQERIERYKGTFKEYLSLAENDKLKARQFFDKAYGKEIEEDIYSKIFPNERPFQYVQYE